MNQESFFFRPSASSPTTISSTQPHEFRFDSGHNEPKENMLPSPRLKNGATEKGCALPRVRLKTLMTPRVCGKILTWG